MTAPTTWSWAARRNDVLVTLLLCLNIGFSWWSAPHAQLIWASQFCAVGVFLLHRAHCEHLNRGAVEGWYGLIWLSIAAVVCAMAWRFENGALLLPRAVLPFVFLGFVSSPNLQTRMGWAMTLGTMFLVFNAFMVPTGEKEVGRAWASPLMMAINIGFLLFFSFTQRQAFAARKSQPSGSIPGAGWALVAIAAVSLASLVAAAPLALTRQALSNVEFPSIGGLPRISTSAKPVFEAQFAGPAPEQPYWRESDAYAFPTGESTWESFYWSRSGGVTFSPVRKALVQADLVAAFIKPVGPGDYRYQTTAIGAPLLEGVYSTETLEQSGDRTVWRLRKAYQDFVYKPYEGFTPALDSAYLSIPDFDKPNTFQSVSLEGAKERMPKTWALVQGWKKEGLTDEQLASRALDYFKANLAYHFDHQSMDPEKNRVDYFLFEDKKGVCRHFANAFAMMMRMGGVRSRVVGGYMGGEYNEATNTWTVRARDAHAWTEIWLEGRGWVRVDPTAVVPVEKGVPEASKSWLSSWFSGVSKSPGKISKSFATSGQAQEQGAGWLPSFPELPTSVLLGVLGVLGLAGIIAHLRRPKGAARRRLADEERQWNKLLKAMRKQGVGIQPHHGPATIGRLFAPALPAQERAAWLETVRAFEQWKFGQVPSPGLSKALAKWRKAIRARKPGVQR